VATFEPYDTVVLQVIRELGLELQVIFNKGAVMVLPSGINKATGLSAALQELALSPHNVIGVGDAENDHAFVERCECSVAVANALPALKEHCDYVAKNPHGIGVREVIEKLLADDCALLAPRLHRYDVQLGLGPADEPVRIPSHGPSVLVTGTSGVGKSTLVTAFIERLVAKDYQAFVLDPEGDYPELPSTLVLGGTHGAPSASEIMHALEKRRQSVVANIIGLKLDDRPLFFQRLLLDLLKLRARTGRPHWIIVDEAHHVFPVPWKASADIEPDSFKEVMLVTLTPKHIPPGILKSIDLVLAIGNERAELISQFAESIDSPPPQIVALGNARADAVAWWRKTPSAVEFRAVPPETVRRRHVRKYMKGELLPEDCFYFEGAHKKLHLRAQNLQLFMQMAEGVDDATWLHHLRKGDYSRWFRQSIKDEELARETERIERTKGLPAKTSRELIRKEIEQRYTAPA